MKPTQEQIDEQMNRAADASEYGTAVPGASYEEGVGNALRWVIGDWSEEPIEKVDRDEDADE